ncbi:DUF805 domain-containing protein [Hellea sp.]|jgi:uncharacterized membrane protein YhaH (DUF805 family)|nr:DUF805 domain-containing protein [Hellea sp.]MBT3592876.1 DUF805 domain-containing protein [Hellea sp.]MBT5835574.1 DUF805 domain-containing protein [Hellea sp.]MDA8887938.1 DUF805 domain-containing protein [Hellea sp.]MDB4845257.1 DUF805 domain-containing protein [Hellea sp.]MDC0422338.1 DUF805 domain-containing protein [Hellea sp.]
MFTPRKILLSPSGRMGRKDFWVGLFILTLLSAVFNFALQKLGNTNTAFLISLPFPFLVLHMTYCVYGKRLHDMGRSFWPLTGMIVLLIFVAIIVMLAFGGTEYFSEFSQYDRKEDIDPEEIERIKIAYQKNLSEGNATVYNIMASIIFIFTLWCGISKGDPNTNSYGQIE